MRTGYFLLIPALALLTFFSCKKKEGEPGREEILTSGKWQVIANKSYATVDTVSYTTDEYGSYQPCEQDNSTTFGSDNHWMTDEGATRCAPGAPQVLEEGTWALAENDTKLLLVIDLFNFLCKINTLNRSTLELEFSSNDTAASTYYRQVITYSHIY